MKRLRWQLLIVLLALVAIAAILLSQQQQPELQAIVPGPATGGLYVEALVGTPGRFNPTLDFYNPVDRDVDRLIYSSLVNFDGRGIPQPDLAESWGISRDATVYNFALRPDAVWHDGEQVTSDDVIFTIELLRDEQYLAPEDLRNLWNAVEIKRLDEKTLQFRLAEPFAPFLDYMAFGILPFHLLGDLTTQEVIDSVFNLKPVGSGPYQFDRLIIEDGQISGVVLSAFDDYYYPRAFIDQIIFQYFPDEQSALSAYENGEVQGIARITNDVLDAALDIPGLNFYTSRLPELSIVLFNLDNPEVAFLQDVEVRKAMLTGLNRQWMIDNMLDGQAILASSPILPGTWAYLDGQQPIEFDREKAIEMLKDAGYTISAQGGGTRSKEGQSMVLELLHPDDEYHTNLAESIREDWQKLGVDVTLSAVPYDSLIQERLVGRDFQAALVELNLSRTPDPDPYPFWHEAQATGGQNYAQWDDRQASEYLEQARIMVDIGERARLYRNFQVRFINELPSLPLFHPVYTYAVSDDVQGITIGPLFDQSDRFANVEQWYLLVEQSVESSDTPTP